MGEEPLTIDTIMNRRTFIPTM